MARRAPSSKQAAPAPPAAPAAPAAPAVSAKEGLAGAVKLVVKTFLEQKHYQELHQLLAQEWSHLHSLTAAIRLMEAHGVHIDHATEERLKDLPEDRMIDALVMRMPQQSREQFEHFFLQLSLIASTTTRLRSALETGNSDAVEEVLDSAENVGILQFILKMAVAQAGQECKSHVQDHEQWLAVASDRMAPMLQSQANAVISRKALEQAKEQLGLHHAEASEKTKKVLLTLAGNCGTALLHTCLCGWAEEVKHIKREAEIRLEYADEIDAAEKKLHDYIMQQTDTMRKMINKNHEQATQDLMAAIFQAFMEGVNEKNDRLAKEQEMKDIEAKMAAFSKDQAAKSKAVLGRMNAGSDIGVMTLCFTAWTQAMEELRKAREFEDAVKAEEAKIAEFMKKSNEGAKSVLTRMSAATDTGLLQSVLQAWIEVFNEQKKAYELEQLMAEQSDKFKSFHGRNKKGAKGAMGRAAELQEENTMIVYFWYWKREAKVERMRRYARDKNTKKKQQLIGVKGLFKNFASELEQGLKDGTPRVDGGATKKKSGRSVDAGPSY